MLFVNLQGELINAKTNMQIKRLSWALLLSAAMLPVSAVTKEKTPAFPGAEGFGRYVTGGRGGAVYHVTSLADDGSQGTLRWALSQKGTRTVVFDVSGTIFLKSELSLTNGNVTIAGQSAPGDGICVADYPFTIKASNVIIRYMRFRLGNREVANHEGDGLGGMDQQNIIVDHCSVSWSIDECLSVYGCKNLTVQWCLVSQSLRESGHSKGAHGYGGNWGGSGATYHHNLMAHHDSRVPRLGPRPSTQEDERMDLRNNVFYNWGGNGCYGGEGMNVNIVNNYYKQGPYTNKRSTQIQQRIAGIGIRTSEYTKHDTDTPNDWDKMWHVWGTFYVDGNYNPNQSALNKDNWTYGIKNQIDNSKCDYTFNATVEQEMKLSAPINFMGVTTHTAQDAYSRVLDYVGASLHRDEVDAQMVYDTRNGMATYTGGDSSKPGIIDSQNDIKPKNASSDWSPWPTLNSTVAPKDTDGDGIPDEWETAHNLDPNNAADGKAKNADGYTNLELYLNSLVEDITTKQNEGGTFEGTVEEEAQESAEYELNQETSNDDWTFTNGFSITSIKGYAEGKSCGLAGIKYSKGVDFTINIPSGLAITKVEIQGYGNDDNNDAYLQKLGDQEYGTSEYVFPSRSGKESKTYSIDLASPVAGTLLFRFNGAQAVANFKLYATSATGIKQVSSDKIKESKTYSLDGKQIVDNYKGVAIKNGKKIIIK